MEEEEQRRMPAKITMKMHVREFERKEEPQFATVSFSTPPKLCHV